MSRKVKEVGLDAVGGASVAVIGQGDQLGARNWVTWTPDLMQGTPEMSTGVVVADILVCDSDEGRETKGCERSRGAKIEIDEVPRRPPTATSLLPIVSSTVHLPPHCSPKWRPAKSLLLLAASAARYAGLSVG
jgi:hypothetical protein